MHISIQTVTPKMADALLESNTRNRNISESKVNEYAREMTAGKWALTHQGISISSDGTLLDGQHRLAAIVKSGVSVKMPVSTGMSQDGAFAVDQLRPRSKADAIKIGGLSGELKAKDVATINSLMTMFFGRKTSSAKEIAGYAEENIDGIRFIQQAFPKNLRGVSSASVRIAFFCAYYYECEDSLRELAKMLHAGIISDVKHSYVVRFRDEIMSTTAGGRSDMIERTKRAMKLINTYCANRKCGRLTTPSIFIYPAPGVEEDE